MLNLPAPPGDDEATATLRRTGFHVAGERLGGAVVLHLHGELDMATSPVLTDALTTALGEDGAEVVVDLTRLTFMDSTGISVLLGAVRRADEASRSFRVRSPNRTVRKTFRLTGVDRILGLEPDEPLIP